MSQLNCSIGSKTQDFRSLFFSFDKLHNDNVNNFYRFLTTKKNITEIIQNCDKR